ncbi:MAG: homoserine dehydrogenase [Saprospiraceae bacterium]|nr:homoserine dehydrogenase [Saprospiraceae bacterium]
MKQLNIGLFGFGCVGQGLHFALQHSTGFKANIKKIVVKHQNKERLVASDLISYDKFEILDDPEIDLIVELIDDANDAFEIVKLAMLRGKHVVTANKKMLALNLAELMSLQQKKKLSLLYEASACGSIPIIRTLEEYFDNEDLLQLSGIFNGTTNYILTKTIDEGIDYQTALKGAQMEGFAESDPTSDVEGFDPKYKAVILCLHAFGLIVHPDKILNLGISSLHANDIRYASEKSLKIKLLPVIRKMDDHQITAYVIPHFINTSNNLYKVDREFNGVIVEGQFSGQQFFQGKGAGSHPTGSAVLSDISALSYDYKYSFKKFEQKGPKNFTMDVSLNVYLRINTKSDLEHIVFKEIHSQYYSKDYNFVVGKISLDQLFRSQNYLRNHKLFCAVIE